MVAPSNNAVAVNYRPVGATRKRRYPGAALRQHNIMPRRRATDNPPLGTLERPNTPGSATSFPW